MDSLIDDFVRRVLDMRHTQPSVTDVLRLANHLRAVTQPQLEEREALLNENAELKGRIAGNKSQTAAAKGKKP